MGDTIRILIAEDYLEAREAIVNQINKFKEFNIELDKCESYQKSLFKINESKLKSKPYHFLFIDIDFTGDDSGGKRNSGFNLINKAFEVCPVSKIATYSAQYKAADLEPEHQEMVRNGLVIYTFDKDHRTDNPREWFSAGFKKLIEEFQEELWLWDVWENHERIKTKLKNYPLSNDQFQNLSYYNEINSNLEAILLLLQRRKIFNADVIIFRLILQLYHRCLEIFVTRDKDEETIVKESDINKREVSQFVNDLMGEDGQLEFSGRKSFLRKLAAFTTDKKYRYGHIVNWYRNGSVHPDKKFTPELTNVLFSILTLSLFVVDKSDIKIQSILKELNDGIFKGRGRKDLYNIINHIQS